MGYGTISYRTKAAKEAELPKTAAGLRDVKLLPMALEAVLSVDESDVEALSGRVLAAAARDLGVEALGG